MRALLDGRQIERHPDTGVSLMGVQIPGWSTILELAVRCGEVFDPGYMGLDVVSDAEGGPLVMEVSALPGLEI